MINNLEIERIYLNCTFKDSGKVKKLGAKWDPNWKMWYIDNLNDQLKFKQWILDYNKKREF